MQPPPCAVPGDPRRRGPTLAQVARLRCVSELRGHSGCVNRLAWRADGGALASVSDDPRLLVWSGAALSEARALATLRGRRDSVATGHRANIFGVAFLPHTDAVVTCGMDAEVRLHALGA